MTNRNDPWAGPQRSRPHEDAPTTSFPSASAPPTEQIRSAPIRVDEPPAPPIMLKRARPSVFIPPEPDNGPVLSRDVGVNRGLRDGAKLPRNRRIAGDLPDWDPAPPGEINVIQRRSPGGS